MAKKMALGRGLDALLPVADNFNQNEIRMIGVDNIYPNPDQPRQHFDEESIRLLADSIQTAGILQPLIVSETESGYMIIAGERRYRAARLAGNDSVPCIIRDYTETQRMEASLIENLQREDLNPIDEARAIDKLIQDCGYTQESAAQKLGKSRPAVTNILRLLKLPDYVQELLLSGELSEGHGRVLAGINDEKQRNILTQRILKEHLSVREAENAAKALADNAGNEENKKTKKLIITPELTDMEERLLKTVGIKAQITGNMTRGKLVFSYRNSEELDALYQMLERLENT